MKKINYCFLLLTLSINVCYGIKRPNIKITSNNNIVICVGDLEEGLIVGNDTLYNGLAKFNSEGQLLWIKNFDLKSDFSYVSQIEQPALFVDSMENIYIAGNYPYELKLDNENIIRNSHYFVAKFDSEGLLKWVKQSETTPPNTSSDAMNFKFLMNSKKMLYLIYNINNDKVLFSPLDEFDTDMSHPNTIILKMDTLGNPIWINGITGCFNQMQDVAIDNFDNLLLAGIYKNQGALSFGNLNEIYLESMNKDLSFLAKISENGVPIKLETYLHENVYLNNVAMDQNNNYFLSGYFDDKITFNASLEHVLDDDHLFLTKYNNKDSLLWAISSSEHEGGGNYTARSIDLKVDNEGFCYLRAFLGDDRKFDSIELRYDCLIKVDNNGSVIRQFSDWTDDTDYHIYNESSISLNNDKLVVISGDVNNYPPSENFRLHCMDLDFNVDYMKSFDQISSWSFISDNKPNNDFLISPNPFKGFINIASENENIKKIEIFDLNGKVFFIENSINLNNVQINTSMIDNGTYIIKITSTNNKYYQTVLVK